MMPSSAPNMFSVPDENPVPAVPFSAPAQAHASDMVPPAAYGNWDPNMGQVMVPGMVQTTPCFTQMPGAPEPFWNSHLGQNQYQSNSGSFGAQGSDPFEPAASFRVQDWNSGSDNNGGSGSNGYSNN